MVSSQFKFFPLAPTCRLSGRKLIQRILTLKFGVKTASNGGGIMPRGKKQPEKNKLSRGVNIISVGVTVKLQVTNVTDRVPYRRTNIGL